MKVYLVIQHDGPSFGEWSAVDKVFLNKQDAENYCNVASQLDEMYGFYVEEKEVVESYQVPKVVEYYNYTFDTEKQTLETFIEWKEISQEEVDKMSEQEKEQVLKSLNHPENRFCNDDEPMKLTYNGDTYTNIEQYGDYENITCYSINSFDEAKKMAMELWSKYES